MIDTLQARIETLEENSAHQDKTLEDLNEVILAQREEIDRLTRRLNKLLLRVDTLEAQAPACGRAASALRTDGRMRRLTGISPPLVRASTPMPEVSRVSDST